MGQQNKVFSCAVYETANVIYTFKHMQKWCFVTEYKQNQIQSHSREEYEPDR